MIKIKKKNSYLLLETIIALFLITICLLPIAQNPIFFLKSQIISLEKMDLERIADLSFSEIKEKLYKNEIPFDEIIKNEEKSKLYNLKDEYILLDKFPQKQVLRNFKICQVKDKKGPGGAKYKLCRVNVFLEMPKKQKQEYIYSLFIQQFNN